jgi:hypothetical protein
VRSRGCRDGRHRLRVVRNRFETIHRQTSGAQNPRYGNSLKRAPLHLWFAPIRSCAGHGDCAKTSSGAQCDRQTGKLARKAARQWSACRGNPRTRATGSSAVVPGTPRRPALCKRTLKHRHINLARLGTNQPLRWPEAMTMRKSERSSPSGRVSEQPAETVIRVDTPAMPAPTARSRSRRSRPASPSSVSPIPS